VSSKSARERILSATRRLLEAGRVDVGLEEVAASASVSRQAVYLHFGSRTKLLLALVDEMDRTGLPEHLAKVANAPDGPAALDAVVDVCAVYTGEIIGVARALDAARRSDPAASAAWEDRMAHRRAGFRSIVRRLAAERRLRSDVSLEDATDLLFAILSVGVWDDLVVMRGWSRRRYARLMKQLLGRALLRDQGHTR
jgi:AcrR family transcriptional regulator